MKRVSLQSIEWEGLEHLCTRGGCYQHDKGVSDQGTAGEAVTATGDENGQCGWENQSMPIHPRGLFWSP